MAQRMSDLLAIKAQQAFVGRDAELEVLRSLLAQQGPRMVHIHGIAGIGKTSLLARFATEARASGAVVVRLDCRQIEPTASGLLRQLGLAIGGEPPDADALAVRLGGLGAVVVLTFDTVEVFRLLDTWLRQVFVPMLPENVRVLFLGREPPSSAWQAIPGWGSLLQSLSLKPLSEPEANQLLLKLGVNNEESLFFAQSTHGHPLALTLVAAAFRNEPSGRWLRATPVQYALEELAHLFLTDVGDASTRRVLEGASVTRRATVSLLGALFPDLAPLDAYERLSQLPFVDNASDGLIIHDAVREAITRSLHANDPSRYLEYRRAAWRQLNSEAEAAGSDDLWRYTADMLYLIENPVVREAFFPTTAPPLIVEQAKPSDDEAITQIIHRHDGRVAATALLLWWHRLPQAFSVVRNRERTVVGLSCKLRSDAIEPTWAQDDPVIANWCDHLSQKPMAAGEIALYCRRWLSIVGGDSPSEVQAAVWLDLKRTYMELRPGLRRVYLTACNLAAYLSVAQRLGFTLLPEYGIELDGHHYPTAMLDFGPGSVDGWLSDLAAAELGVQHADDLIDVDARELVLVSGRVSLTPLEFGVIHHLHAKQGKAVSRRDLLRDVWGTTYEGGSNVVDAVVRTLRRKLGKQSAQLETVTGVGYRLKPKRL
ncbi:winged helix-turn-helix domain-containing protein [Saccharospirillum sp.]|uniref:winged helix-turn-helix domain-containing protein n=1 Tax=Saccharospirillum sp. TaxID=2033801 RepID=UPI0034A077D4